MIVSVTGPLGDGTLSTTIVQPRHMARFACLGPDCPDTCCKDWAVDVDPATVRLWRNHPDPHWRERLGAGLRRFRKADGGERQLVAMRPDGHCVFYGEDGLCGIQKELGAEAMPWICRVFPRGEQAERDFLARTGSLACTAVARAVVSEDRPLDETVEGPIGPTLLALQAATTKPAFTAREAWAVRRTALTILGQPTWSWEARLVLTALLAGELATLDLVRGRQALPSLLDRYAAAAREAEPPGVAAELAAGRAQGTALLVPVLKAILEGAREPVPGKIVWAAFVSAALDRLGVTTESFEEAAQRAAAVVRDRLGSLHADRPRLFPNLLGALLHQVRFPGERPKDALGRLGRAIVAFATWRILTAARLDAGVADPLEAAAEVAWKLGRHLAHSQKVLDRAIEGLSRAGGLEPARLLLLAA